MRALLVVLRESAISDRAGYRSRSESGRRVYF
jgi:hypothetical protein